MRIKHTVLGLMLVCCSSIYAAQTATWMVTEGGAGGGRYSTLTDINKENVKSLKVAWVYRHKDFQQRGILPDRVFKGTAFEATPILVENKLIFSTPFNRVIALNPETGKEMWTFNPQVDVSRRFANMIINRGVAYYQGRIFIATLDARLIALDINTGLPIKSFGKNGTVDLYQGIENLTDKWEYNITSPPTIVGDNVIVGSSLADITRRVMPSGAVRAYNAKTGKLVWRFNTIPKAEEFGTDTWKNDSWKHHGGANVWSTMTADLKRGMVFLPVSTAGPDLYGGDRKGANLFSDSLVALDANTGKRIWHFQTVHHDLWDYDLASPPILVTVNKNGKKIDAVAQLTKTGFVFILNRETGKPIFPVIEKPVPQSDVPGEETWPTQPYPTKPPALVPQRLTENDLWQQNPKRYQKCLRYLRKIRNEGMFTPPSLQGSILYPGATGGMNWSGASYDPHASILYVPANNIPMVQRLRKLPEWNYLFTGGKPLHGGIKGIFWAVTGLGTGLRYSMLERGLLAFGGVYCNKPPWGIMSAVDVDNGKILWQVPIGINKDGVRGLINLGPPLVTASGLLFHGGTIDQRLWVYDVNNGKVITSFKLPAGLHAGPMTYKINGKQYLVIAPGGHIILGSKLGDYIIAYILGVKN